MNSLHEITDISRHLDERVQDVVFDKMHLLQVCGYTPIIGTAVTMAAAVSLVRLAIGMSLSQLPEHRREAAFEEALQKLVAEVRKAGPRVLKALREADQGGA